MYHVVRDRISNWASSGLKLSDSLAEFLEGEGRAESSPLPAAASSGSRRTSGLNLDRMVGDLGLGQAGDPRVTLTEQLRLLAVGDSWSSRLRGLSHNAWSGDGDCRSSWGDPAVHRLDQTPHILVGAHLGEFLVEELGLLLGHHVIRCRTSCLVPADILAAVAAAGRCGQGALTGVHDGLTLGVPKGGSAARPAAEGDAGPCCLQDGVGQPAAGGAQGDGLIAPVRDQLVTSQPEAGPVRSPVAKVAAATSSSADSRARRRYGGEYRQVVRADASLGGPLHLP